MKSKGKRNELEAKMEIDDEEEDEFVEEEIYVIANFAGFDDPRILEKIPTNIEGDEIQYSVNMDNLFGKSPVCDLHGKTEFKGKQEISLGSTLLFKESNDQSPFGFAGNTLNSIQFELSTVKILPNEAECSKESKD